MSGSQSAPFAVDSDGSRTYTIDGCVTCYQSEFEIGRPLKRCAKCCTKYCSAKCQKKDWRTHKQLCNILGQLHAHRSLFENMELSVSMTDRRTALLGMMDKQLEDLDRFGSPIYGPIMDAASNQIPRTLVAAYRKTFKSQFLPLSTIEKSMRRADVGREKIADPEQPPMKYWSYERVSCMYKFQVVLNRKVRRLLVSRGWDSIM